MHPEVDGTSVDVGTGVESVAVGVIVGTPILVDESMTVVGAPVTVTVASSARDVLVTIEVMTSDELGSKSVEGSTCRTAKPKTELERARTRRETESLNIMDGPFHVNKE